MVGMASSPQAGGVMLNPGVLLVVPEAASFAAFFKGVATACLDAGYRVGLAVDNGSVDATWHDRRIAVYPMPAYRAGNPSSLLRAGAALRQAVAAFEPALVHSHFLAGCLVAAIARAVFGSKGPAWIGTFHGLHGPTADDIASRVIAGCELWAARRLDSVWVLTRDDQDYLRSAGGVGMVNLYGSYGVGCDLQRFDRSRFPPEAKNDARRELGIGGADFVVCYVGRAVSFKGYPEVIRGFWRMAASHKAAWLVVVGAEDTVHRTGLRREESRRMMKDSRIIRVGWKTDVVPMLLASDVLALPSRREGRSVAIMEALACGIPVVTSASRGCGDVVRHGVDGLVLEDVSAEAVGDALTMLLNDSLLRQRMSSNAIAGRSRFSRLAYEREQLAIYRRFFDLHERIVA
jgi:glycosyltransferase involved in cell wall biosynthesis